MQRNAETLVFVVFVQFVRFYSPACENNQLENTPTRIAADCSKPHGVTSFVRSESKNRHRVRVVRDKLTIDYKYYVG